MTADTLRQLSHEALMAHVQHRVTGQDTTPEALPLQAPASSQAQSECAPTSTYISLDGVPPVRIHAYPKRHPSASDRLTAIVLPNDRAAKQLLRTDELCYADFFLRDEHAKLVAS